MRKRSYGTGHLYEKRGAWYGRWRDPAGKLLNRKVAPKRTPGERDGLTKPQAEQRLQQMIDSEAVAARASARVTVAEAGAALVVKLEAGGGKKSYVQTVESIVRVHLAPSPQLRGKDLAR